MALRYMFQKVITDAALLNISADINKKSRDYFIKKGQEIQNQRPERILLRKDIKENLQSQLMLLQQEDLTGIFGSYIHRSLNG